MSSLKKLASQTAYYGLSSILGRMLNYALVPLHTRILHQQHDYGIIGELYAYVTFLNILFLYGMETAFFRFASRDRDMKETYANSFTAVLCSSILFSGLIIFFAQDILMLLQPSGDTLYKKSYIIYFAFILGLDAITAIPFARLRLENRPRKFAGIRLINIGVNVLFNLFFLLICPWLIKQYPNLRLMSFYNPSNLVGYIFISNLIASALTVILLYKEILGVQLKVQWVKLKPMLIYAIPLFFAGLAGMTNETLDRILLKYFLPGTLEERLAQIGIYNAAYKLSIFMTLAIQAFRMAAEPFFFSTYKETNAQQVYARVMNYFVMTCCVIFLGVMLHINLIEFLLGEEYRQGLYVVPILLLANLFLGIYLNLSIWYKLVDKTVYGIAFTFLGAFVTIWLNILWIPKYGFLGSAYATFACYFLMALFCYIVGQKYYKVPYNTIKIGGYLSLMYVFYLISKTDNVIKMNLNKWEHQLLNTFLFLLFIVIVYWVDFRNIKLKKYEG